MDNRGLPPQTSNFYGLPGRAGGTPNGLGDITTTTSAGFAASPAVLSLSSQNGGRDAAVIGIGARSPITNRLGIYAHYTADLRRDATSQVFSAGLRWVW